MILIITGVVIAAVAGVAIVLVSSKSSSGTKVTWQEFGIGMLVCSLLVVPAVSIGGTKLARSNQITYDEFWNGYETAALVDVTNCTRDGACVREYDCDPYTEIEHYTEQVPYTTTETYTTADGKTSSRSVTKYRSEQRTRTVTKYHSCPYATKEYTYKVETTLGSHTLGSHLLAEDAQAWRAFHPIPSWIERGVPKAWSAAKNRIDSGYPGGVTQVEQYDNYILASQSTILAKYSDAVETYKKAKMLPKPADRVHTSYLADKVYVVGATLEEPKWDEALMRLNGAIGSELRGDLHLVVVKDVKDPDEYAGALMAYWQSKELKKKAISKNSIVVVLGTSDNKTVEWARAATGMPTGNEEMLTQIESELKGEALEAEHLLGKPKAVVTGDDVMIEHTDGVLEGILWGPNKFARVCMACEGSDDTGVGFSYLSSEIQPSGGQKVAIVSAGAVLSLVVWGIFLHVGGGTRTQFGRYPQPHRLGVPTRTGYPRARTTRRR